MRQNLTTPTVLRGIGARLVACFGGVQLVTLLAVAVAGLGLWQVRAEQSQREQQTVHLATVGQWSALVQANLERALLVTRIEAASSENEALGTGLVTLKSRLVQDMSDTAQQTLTLQEKLTAATAAEPGLQAAVEVVQQRRQQFVDLRAQINNDLQLGEGAARIDAELAPAAQAMLQALQALASHVQARSASADQALGRRLDQALLWLLAGSTAALLLSVGLALFSLDPAVGRARAGRHRPRWQGAKHSHGLCHGEHSQRRQRGRGRLDRVRSVFTPKVTVIVVTFSRAVRHLHADASGQLPDLGSARCRSRVRCVRR